MSGVQFASPWWVNFCALVPFLVYCFFRKKKLQILGKQLLMVSIFGVAFGFVEAAVVVYLRSAVGLLGADILPGGLRTNEQTQLLSFLPSTLVSIELLREIATIIMLGSIGLLAANQMRERLALFLWIFATWDIFYYIFLWLTISWPTSLLSTDVLFLIPVAWLAQVWFPLLVSLLTIMSILASRKHAAKGNNPSIQVRG